MYQYLVISSCQQHLLEAMLNQRSEQNWRLHTCAPIPAPPGQTPTMTVVFERFVPEKTTEDESDSDGGPMAMVG